MHRPISSGPPYRRRHPYRAAVCAALLLNACVTPPGFGGPMPVRNQHPVQLTAMRLDPIAPDTTPANGTRLDVKFSYSSLFLRGDNGAGNTFVMDGEILRTGVKVRRGITDTFEIDFELPLAHSSGGFLDHFVEEWHDVFGFPTSGRDNFPENQFSVEARFQGASIYEMEDRTLTLLDVPIGATWQFLPETEGRPFAMAARAGIELPTGNDRKGYGNGGIDVSLGLVASTHYGPFALTVHGEHTFVHTPNQAKAAGFEFADVTSYGAGLEATWTEDTALLVQFELDRSVLRRLTGARTEDDQWMLWIGLRTRMTPALAVEIGFGEDLTLNAPPDFTAFVGFQLRLEP